MCPSGQQCPQDPLFSLPDTNLTFSFSPDGNWSFPTGSVWIKHFELESPTVASFTPPAGDPAADCQRNWRLLDHLSLDHASTNALLVASAGWTSSSPTTPGGANAGAQTWHYPSRVECLFCHTAAALRAWFQQPQLNRDFTYAGAPQTNRSACLGRITFRQRRLQRYLLRALASEANDQASREYRVLPT